MYHVSGLPVFCGEGGCLRVAFMYSSSSWCVFKSSCLVGQKSRRTPLERACDLTEPALQPNQDVTLQTLAKKLEKRHQNKFLFQHPPTTGAYFWEPFSAFKKPVRLETSCWRVRHRRYDVIDLDPYGTVSPFIDAAVQVRPGLLGCWGGVEVDGGFRFMWSSMGKRVSRIAFRLCFA